MYIVCVIAVLDSHRSVYIVTIADRDPCCHLGLHLVGNKPLSGAQRLNRGPYSRHIIPRDLAPTIGIMPDSLLLYGDTVTQLAGIKTDLGRRKQIGRASCRERVQRTTAEET